MTRPTAHDAEEQTPQNRGRTRIAGWRLTRPELFALVLAVVFAYIAQEVIAEREWERLDAVGTQWVQARSTASLTAIMRWVSKLHNTLPISAAIALLAVLFAMRRRREDLILLLSIVPLGMLLNVAMKHTFLRARPPVAPLSDLLDSYSFPSGHVAASTLLYGFLVVLVFRETERTSLRGAAFAGAVMAVVSVAVSRVYLGVHYTTDVAAAAVEALGWLCLSWAMVGFWFRSAGSSLAGQHEPQDTLAMSTGRFNTTLSITCMPRWVHTLVTSSESPLSSAPSSVGALCGGTASSWLFQWVWFGS